MTETTVYFRKHLSNFSYPVTRILFRNTFCNVAVDYELVAIWRCLFHQIVFDHLPMHWYMNICKWLYKGYLCHILSLVCSYKTNIFCILFIGNWYFNPSNMYIFKQKTKCLNISFLIIYLSLFSSLILWMIKSKTIF